MQLNEKLSTMALMLGNPADGAFWRGCRTLGLESWPMEGAIGSMPSKKIVVWHSFLPQLSDQPKCEQARSKAPLPHRVTTASRAD